MPPLIEVTTPRLFLRQWRDRDLDPFAQLNADPMAMKYFPAPLSRNESDAMAERCRALIAEQGWGFWAVELQKTGAFIGFVGLNHPRVDLPFSPCVEVGWRLLPAYWGKGLATEAAQRALQVGFGPLGLEQIVSFTAVQNGRSRAVMERLGMNYQGTFEHPSVPAETGLRFHCWYNIRATTNFGE